MHLTETSVTHDSPRAELHTATSPFVCSDPACCHCAERQAAAGRAWRQRRFTDAATVRRAVRDQGIVHVGYRRLAAAVANSL